MKNLLPIALICAVLSGCSKDDNNTQECPKKYCDHKAERNYLGQIMYGEDCKNEAEPCKNYCKEHRNEEQK